MSKQWKIAAALAVVLLGGWLLLRWAPWQAQGPGPGFVSGNGRIEATEIAVATKLAGRVLEVLVAEGDFVKAGQPLARMQIDGLQAQREEALARLQQAQLAISSAQVQVAQRESDYQAALAVVAQRESDLDTARRRLPRSEQLAREGFFSSQLLDDDRAKVRSQQAAVTAAKAQAKAAQAGISASRTQVTSAEANVRALQATLARIDVELADSELKAPRDGRVQFRVVQPGEVVGAGARVLQLVDLSDVYMTFFLPETVAGRVALGSEVRIVLDAAPGFVIPAEVSFVASTAQFTPKTVETASERQKLMFRVRAQIDKALLLRHQEQVKTGLPGVAWLRVDPAVEWPANLAVKAGQ
ncbi:MULTISPECIES: HlyD family secretion protein [Acidovorax]|uniref:HlyD family secretion protein n=1 Tax=Acidovorax facilis TaxID=12917 RepID=A0ABV8D849_9BURK|nr:MULTISPECIES: HlyD family efflux transporter periplasmic adaptor subunit [Acidovorax]MBO1007036.1 HlyD family efflux transporter periplasmic adaptor subunit [Acidovorax sp. SD340]MCO4243470.1 HlyD family efflux transporter periplasmic adaptor subunit [Acidovorax facilis]